MLDCVQRGDKFLLNCVHEDEIVQMEVPDVPFKLFAVPAIEDPEAEMALSAVLSRNGIRTRADDYKHTTRSLLHIPRREYAPERNVIRVKYYTDGAPREIRHLPRLFEAVYFGPGTRTESFLMSRAISGCFDVDAEDVTRVAGGFYAHTYKNLYASTDPAPALRVAYLVFVRDRGSLFWENAERLSEATQEEVLEELEKIRPHVLCVHRREFYPEVLRRRVFRFSVLDVANFVKQLCPKQRDYSTEALCPTADKLAEMVARLDVLSVVQALRELTCLPISRIANTLDRVEWMVVKEFRRNRIVFAPHVYSAQQRAGYRGGLVMKPRPGLYRETVLEFDFFSHYPSLCAAYGICWTPSGLVLPPMFRRVLQRRKALGEGPMRLALKLMANTAYGGLACVFSRLFSVELAAAITARGRELLETASNLAIREFRLQVICGDTDSLFVRAGAESVGPFLERAAQVLPEGVLLEHASTYTTFALWPVKKTYVAVDSSGRQIVKHNALKKRVYAPLFVRACRRLVDMVLEEGFRLEDAWTLAKETLDRMQGAPAEDLVIIMELKKALASYADRSAMHVRAAHKLPRLPLRGDFISFVVCGSRDPTPLSALPEGYAIDYKWYTEQFVGMLEQILSLLPDFRTTQMQDVLVPSASSILSSSSSSPTSVLEGPRDPYAARRPLTAVCGDCGEPTTCTGYRELVRLLTRAPHEHASILRAEECYRESARPSCAECGVRVQFREVGGWSPATPLDFGWRYALYQIACAECRQIARAVITKDKDTFVAFRSLCEQHASLSVQ